MSNYGVLQTLILVLAMAQASQLWCKCYTAAAGPATAALFVFGDSYGDTGNHHNDSDTLPNEYKPWRTPYGMTWPGSPSGRYSDGGVFTDFYASYLGVSDPLPYRTANKTTLCKDVGINFAFGGSGVFPTASYCPNVSAQIAQFQGTIDDDLVSIELINASTVLLLVNGNDYTHYITENGIEGIQEFIPTVVEQIKTDMQSLYDLGFKNIVVANIGPVGCLPSMTASNNHTSCVESLNALADLHNSLLGSQVSDLQTTFPNATFTILNFNEAFQSALKDFTSLSSCCEGTNDSSYCGDLNNDGEALYTICSSVLEAFYWDEFHPTNVAWDTISKYLFSGLNKHG